MDPRTTGGPLRGLQLLRKCKTKRISSYDVTGGNADRRQLEPGEKVTLARIKGAGCITHIWFTLASNDRNYLRNAILRMYWDGERSPSVEAPIGDFFCVGHGAVSSFNSLPFNMSARDGDDVTNAGMNCYLPMPFADGARITLENDSGHMLGACYFYIDYEEWDKVGDDQGRFHAQWRRVNPCQGRPDGKENGAEPNLSNENNYVFMEATGRGHFIGCNLSVHNRHGGWWGEGDDMFFIDGQPWPPSLHGTGSEDYFGHAWGMQDNCSEYNGTSYHRGGHCTQNEKITVYRFHIQDPVVFHKSLHASIEHGHANARSDDYSSTAYWYQTEPHAKFPKLPGRAERAPLEFVVPTQASPVEDFCRAWVVCGPFDNPRKGRKRTGLSVKYGPEKERFGVNATYKGKDGATAYWRPARVRETGELDFTQVFGRLEYAVCYARTNIYSASARKATLLLGSDDGCKVLLNRKEVHKFEGDRGAFPDTDQVEIDLKKGWNEVLVKVEQGKIGWGLIMRVVTSDGSLRYSAQGA